MALNYHRTFIAGLDAKTSTPSEVSHKSIKYGDYKVTSGMSIYTSCHRQATKAEVRSFSMAKNIAQKACKNIIQNDSNTREYLTPWAENLAEAQRKQMNDYWIVQISFNQFIMIKPTTIESEKLRKMNEQGEKIHL